MNMEQLVPVFYDVAAVAIVILCANSCAKKGFVRTILDLTGYVVSLLAAFFVSKLGAVFLYTTIVRRKITEMLTKTLAQVGQSGTGAMMEQMEEILADVPKIVRNIFDVSIQEGTDISSFLQGEISAAVQRIEAELIAPMLTSLIQIILFIIAFAIFSFLARKVSQIVGGMFNMPVIGPVNRVAGLLLGALQGLLMVYLISLLMQLFMLLFGQKPPYLTYSAMHSTLIMRLLDHLPLI